MIGIEADFNENDLDAMIQGDVNAWFEALVDEFRQAGIRFVDRAIEKAIFNNITWNLRSSIGYLIIYDGKILESYFKDLKSGTEGQEVGREYAEIVAKVIDTGEGLSMALVAGEEYAYYVQARTGYDVIDGSYAYFETELKTALR